ncbi:hypothetical protein ACSBR2_014827 [Camellia fascicularis]
MCLLHRLRANLSLFLITITLLTTISSVFGQPTYNYHFCSNTTYNDTAIKTLLGSLSSKAAHNNSFYKDISNDLHGLYQCRGDVATDMCQKCVEAAIQEIQQPSRCQSRSRADIWYDECVLRYAHTNFFGTVKLYPVVLMYNTRNASSPNNTYVDTLPLMNRLASEAGKEPMMYYAHDELPATVGDVAQKNDTLSLMNRLASEAGKEPMMFFAHDELPATVVDVVQKNVSAMVQCSKDMSGDQCNRCLQNLTMYAETCCLEKSGWRILAPSCNMRYEEYRFLTPSAPPPVPPPAPTTTSKGKVVLIITVPVSTFLVVAAGFYFYRLSGRRSKAREGKREKKLKGFGLVDTLNTSIDTTLNPVRQHDTLDLPMLDFNKIVAATNSFSINNKLGEGGFGPVFKGNLQDGQEIAVKRLSRCSEQGIDEFKNEIRLISRLQHNNLVRLLGCCIEGAEMLIVYEYMHNKSLDTFLFDATKRGHLDWTKRFNIIQGITRGLLYLHRDSRLKIIHRDLKVSNILLDKDMNPKISDFGLARTFRGTQQLANTHRLAGTIGYMSPEYALRGIFSERSDVFSFGVLLLEIICGRKNTSFHDEQYTSLLVYVWHLWNEGRALDFMDQALVDSCCLPEVMRCIHIALLCVQDNAADRPTMSSIALMLTSEIDSPQPKQPTFTLGSDLQSQNKNICSVNEVTVSMLEGR